MNIDMNIDEYYGVIVLVNRWLGAAVRPDGRERERPFPPKYWKFILSSSKILLDKNNFRRALFSKISGAHNLQTCFLDSEGLRAETPLLRSQAKIHYFSLAGGWTLLS
jgi:hypothetical protein